MRALRLATFPVRALTDVLEFAGAVRSLFVALGEASARAMQAEIDAALDEAEAIYFGEGRDADR